MNVAKGALAFLNIVLIGAAIHMYFQPREGSIALPLTLAVCGAIAGVIAANMDRLFNRNAKSFDGDNVGDITIPRSSNREGAGPEYED
jgi:hypothetical protein